MTFAERLTMWTIRGVTHLLCRVHDEELVRVPMHGPLILVSNHINFLEIPVLYTRLQPRRVTTLAKAETWDNPLLGYLFDMGQGIPLHRGEADVGAIRRALEVLEGGGILAIAPEGTRSNDGKLRRGHPGVELLARRSGAPLLPMVFYGNEQYRHNLVRLRRTDFHVVVGHPFYVDAGGTRVTGAVRQTIVDEVMYQLAALLPLPYRGFYANLDAATEGYLRFRPPAVSNLRSIRAD